MKGPAVRLALSGRPSRRVVSVMARQRLSSCRSSLGKEEYCGRGDPHCPLLSALEFALEFHRASVPSGIITMPIQIDDKRDEGFANPPEVVEK
jgi:hypothetical protein